MNKSEIEVELKKCNSTIELISKANELKKMGARDTTVNTVVSKLRLSMNKTIAKTKSIPRVGVDKGEPQLMSYIGFEVKDLGRPVIDIIGDKIIL